MQRADRGDRRPSAPRPHLGRAAVRPLVAAPVGGAPGPLRDARPARSRCCCSWRRSSRRSGTCATRSSSASRRRCRRDTEVAQQQLRLRLIENHEQLARMARELVTRTLDRDAFLVQAAGFTRERPEITQPDLARATGAQRDRQLLGHDLPARDRHQRRRHAGVAAGRELAAASPRRPSARARELRQTGVLAAVRRQLRQPGVPGRRSR